MERSPGPVATAQQAASATPMVRIVLQNLPRQQRGEHIVKQNRIGHHLHLSMCCNSHTFALNLLADPLLDFTRVQASLSLNCAKDGSAL
jgi:hypothetical protein